MHDERQTEHRDGTGPRPGPGPRRRSLLAGLPLAALGAAAVGCTDDGADGTDGGKGGRTGGLPVQLRGAEPPVHAQFIALDAAGGPGGPGRDAVAGLLKDLDAAVEGSDVTAGVALGAGAFAAGSAARPRRLRPMPAFTGDLLDDARTHGDLLLHLAGPSRGDVREAVDRILARAPGWRVRWRAAGFRDDSRTAGGRGLTRDPFGFTEGHGNPAADPETAGRTLVRAGDGEPGWAVGGSYQVVRVIRLATALWDRDTVHEQERIIGRRRDGRWLDGTPATTRPDFGTDPQGRLTPLDAHVRRAAPDRCDPPPLVRRSYAYDSGPDDRGLLFSCFQRDLAAGFETVQRRLAGEAMTQYQLTVGGGYFFVPPPGDAWPAALG
ncbi:Dyp-type peroxidase [Streptomyces sp. NPDC094049]|uniref:Dyp-type peroxidase n=1 Tax=Streptomyces sp. NPDC094049 TaxID=3154987 RepID=UPI003325485C